MFVWLIFQSQFGQMGGNDSDIFSCINTPAFSHATRNSPISPTVCPSASYQKNLLRKMDPSPSWGPSWIPFDSEIGPPYPNANRNKAIPYRIVFSWTKVWSKSKSGWQIFFFKKVVRWDRFDLVLNLEFCGDFFFKVVRWDRFDLILNLEFRGWGQVCFFVCKIFNVSDQIFGDVTEICC